MKKTICILCALTVLAALCGTASCEQTGPDLYHIGLEVTGLMGEIAGNEAYLSAFGRPETWTEVRVSGRCSPRTMKPGNCGKTSRRS